MSDLPNLREYSAQILKLALAAVEPSKAVADRVHIDGTELTIIDSVIDLRGRPLYVVGLGKAATTMALGLENRLSSFISAGVISDSSSTTSLSGHWTRFSGGHPFPNDASLAAAKAAFSLLETANQKKAVVIFLVSGGGSAMMEAPINDDISLADLSRANRILVTCGATIKEINSVRCRLSAVKCGGLAMRAPNAEIITLIVSDTNEGDEAAVASGPTLPRECESWQRVVELYRLGQALPQSILKALHDSKSTNNKLLANPYYVILNNRTAMVAAARAARQLGYEVVTRDDIVEQEIDEGTRLLLKVSQGESNKECCVISGGEFKCPVRGDGVGGRNLETVLRAAISMSEAPDRFSKTVMLSVGTDGIDGNSPAAGAIADVNTVSRAIAKGLDCVDFLARSDSYHLFQALDDLIVTGPTGTNVRDLRLILTHPED